jgi:MFS family permease
LILGNSPFRQPPAPRPQLAPLPWLRAEGVALCSFVLLAVWAPKGLVSGDAAIYARQALDGDFVGGPLHVGYYRLASVALPAGATDLAFSLFSCACAALALGVLYLLATHLTGQRDAALAAPAVLLANVVFVGNGVVAGVSALTALWAALAWLVWCRHRPILTGGALAMAFLVTPSSALAALALPWLRLDRRGLMMVVGVGTAVTYLALMPIASEFLYGEGGVAQAFQEQPAPGEIAWRQGLELLQGVLATIPLLAAGAWRAWRQPGPSRHYLGALITLGLAAAAFGGRLGDVPAQLVTLLFAAPLVVWGFLEVEDRMASPLARIWLVLWTLGAALAPGALWVVREKDPSLAAHPAWLFIWSLGLLAIGAVAAARLRPRSLRVASVALVGSVLLVGLTWTALAVARQKQAINDFRERVVTFGQTARTPHLVLTSREQGVLIEHYLSGRAKSERWLDVAWLEGDAGEEQQAEAFFRWQSAVGIGREIWLIGVAPSHGAALEATGYSLDEPVPGFVRATRAGSTLSPPRPANAHS